MMNWAQVVVVRYGELSLLNWFEVPRMISKGFLACDQRASIRHIHLIELMIQVKLGRLPERL